MKIAILDDYQNCISTLKAFKLLDGHDIQILNKHYESEDQLASDLDQPEALVLNRTRTKITASLLDKLPSVKVVSQTGKNAGHIDVTACEARDVVVLEGKGDPIATAELSWALIMNGLRLIPQAVQGMKNGHWQTNIGRRIYGKTIGIWSYGRIGKRVADYAKAFGANVMVWGGEESTKTASENGFEVAPSKEIFLQTIDVLSLHIRFKERTKGIVTLDDLRQMKTDALLVNTSRAGLIEEGALVKALKEGTPGFAAIDVFDEEPIFNKNHPLFQMPNVICTPHLGYVERSSYELYFGIAFRNLVEEIGVGG